MANRRLVQLVTFSRYYSNNTSNGYLFNHPQLSSPEGFNALTRDTLKLSETLSSRIIENNNSTRDTLRLFDELSDTLCRAADLAECVRLLHPEEGYVSRAEECCTVLGNYVEQLNTRPELYRALKLIHRDNLDEASTRHANILLHDFEVSGIHLSVGKRERVVELNREILLLSHTFVNQCSLPPQPLMLDIAPQSIRNNKHLFHIQDGAVYIDSVPYMSPDRSLRQDCYHIYYNPSHPNGCVLDALLSARHQLAQLVGYRTFSHRTLKGSMAGSPEVVMEFLDALNEKIQPLARQEARDMLAVLNSEGEESDRESLSPWDHSFLFQKLRNRLFKESVNLPEHFPLSSCMHGISHLLQELFDVQVQLTSTLPGEVWHSSINKFSFVRQGHLLGYLYCDWFNRVNKSVGDCQFTIQGGRICSDGSYQIPISTLSLSLSHGNPPLLSQQAVQNLFHEMGHALHSILGRSPYQNTSGTRCPTDFAEMPSNLMELLLQDPRVFMSFANHYKTHQSLSPNGISSFTLSSNLNPAFMTQEQILYSVMDQHFHSSHPLNTSTINLFSDLHNKYSVVDHAPNTAWFLRFTHLYAYGGKYYSYLWSRAVANLIWQKCFRDDPFSRSKGKLYETAILAHGGGAHPLNLVESVLGYKPKVQELVDAYYNEIITLKEQINNMGTH